jgi:hypothetical protein
LAENLIVIQLPVEDHAALHAKVHREAPQGCKGRPVAHYMQLSIRKVIDE